jgi:hypothetical protein
MGLAGKTEAVAGLELAAQTKFGGAIETPPNACT